MKIKRKYAPIYKDATILLRPKTGLKDMYLSARSGHTRGRASLTEGERDPGRQHAARREPGRDPRRARRGHARLPARAAERGRRGFRRRGGQRRRRRRPPQDLRETFKRFEPTARDARAITAQLAKRRRNMRRVIHNFQELATELGTKDTQLAALVDSSNANFEALAAQDANLRESLRLLPGHARARPRRRCARPARWPASSARRSQELRPGGARARPVAARRRARSCARPRRSSATRSARSPATCARPCATCAAPPRTWRWSPRASRARSRC